MPVTITDQLPTTLMWEIQMLWYDGSRWAEVETIRFPDPVVLTERLDLWKQKWPDREFRVVEVTTTRKVHSA
jgi:hypothetical protein